MSLEDSPDFCYDFIGHSIVISLRRHSLLHTRIYAFSLLVFALLSGCKSSIHYNGYIEDSSVKLSVPVYSTMISHRDEGAFFKKGQQIARLSAKDLQLKIQAKQSLMASMESELANIKTGLRTENLDILLAKKQIAIANLAFADAELQRVSKLKQQNHIAQSSLDKAKQAKSVALQSVKMSELDYALGKKGQRENLLKALQHKINAAKLELQSLNWSYNQLTIIAPFDGQIENVFFENHERVAPNQPVISIVAPSKQHVIFYLEEGVVNRIKKGDEVQIIVPFSKHHHQAKITYISTKPEFTPPILFDQQARSPYTYKVKAVLVYDQDDRLHSGQAVTIQVPKA